MFVRWAVTRRAPSSPIGEDASQQRLAPRVMDLGRRQVLGVEVATCGTRARGRALGGRLRWPPAGRAVGGDTVTSLRHSQRTRSGKPPPWPTDHDRRPIHTSAPRRCRIPQSCRTRTSRASCRVGMERAPGRKGSLGEERTPPKRCFPAARQGWPAGAPDTFPLWPSAPDPRRASPATPPHLSTVSHLILPSHQATAVYAHMLVYSSAPHTTIMVKANGNPTAPNMRLNRPGESLSQDLQGMQQQQQCGS